MLGDLAFPFVTAEHVLFLCLPGFRKVFLHFRRTIAEKQTGDLTRIAFPPVTSRLTGDYRDVGECTDNSK